MKVSRYRFPSGYIHDGELTEYKKAEVVQRDSGSWPGHGFIFTTGHWLDHEPKPSKDYLRLYMYGASILLTDSTGFTVTGFVPGKDEDNQPDGNFTLERWHVYK